MTQNLPSQACMVASLLCPPSTYDSAGGDGDGDGGARSESLPQSPSSMKGRDYIGIAEVSKEAQDATRLMMMEPDLRLGLGLPNPAGVVYESRESSSPAGFRALDDAFGRSKPRSLVAQHCPSQNILSNVLPIACGNGQPSSAQLGFFRSSSKRFYEEAMAHAPENLSMVADVKSVTARFTAADSRSSIGPSSSKPETQDPSETFLYQIKARPNGMSLSGAANGEGHSKIDLRFSRDGANLPSFLRQDNSSEEGQLAKGQVVGWPPVRSYRRSAVAAFTKPDRHEGVGHSSRFVKVNMDGSPIGRKVDLRAHESYDGLLSALENMFQKLNGGHVPQSLNCADFFLTYEDKEGDWMLVGDIPWELFVETVRRLRITRGSDVAGGSSVLAASKLL